MLLRSRRAIALASRVAARRERTVAGASIAAGSRPPTLARGASTEPAPERFEVKVYTANRRGASTLADVGLELVGRGNAAASIHTGPSTEFERASVSKMTVRTADVGDLDRLVVRHALSATDPPSPWLLERVVVKRSSDGRRWNFPCGFWFDTAPGTTSTRTLFAASHAEQRTQVEAALLSGQPLARPLRLLVATASRPHPQKEEEGEEGEDASFSTSIMLGAGDEGDSAGVRPRRLFCVGVADGVAEWALRGVDAGVYARRLTSLARTAFENGHTDPVEVMTAAWSGVRHDGVQGSSTLCIVTVDAETGQLDAANLGDSGFLVARGGKVLFRSPELEHSFGHPYQLSSAGADTPADAQVQRLSLAKGDVIVVASDGLFDNVGDEEVAERLWLGRHVAVGQLAQFLCDTAFQRSVDKRADTPWARAARDEFNLVYNGGKRDDITVVLAKVVYA